MSTETSYYFHNNTAYRRIENMSPTNSGALAKRAGTKLVLTDTREVYVFSTRDSLYVFFDDNKYKVIKLSDFTNLKAETANPTDLKFVDIKNSIIQTIVLTTGETRILIPTPSGIFTSDVAYVFSKVTLTGLPANTPTSLFIALPGRGLIANGNTLYFSKYNDIYNFTPLSDPTASDAPIQGYVQKFAVGLDGDILDIIFYKNSIIIGTTLAIYRLEYTQLNPFADVVAKTSISQRLEKIYSVGLEFKTFADIGDFVVFANDRGIYGIEIGRSTSNNIDSARINTIEFTYSQEHIVSEDGQSIIDISSFYARENVFFALRNDGVIFKCAITRDQDKRAPLLTRYIAGISMDNRRKYVSIDHNCRAYITNWGGRYFVELHKVFPYLNDNKQVFSWHDTLETLLSFGFLDCFQNSSELKLLRAGNNTGFPLNQIKAEPGTFVVGEKYYYLDLINGKYNIFTVASVKKQVVTITDQVQDIIVLGKVKTEQDLNLLQLTTISEGADLYVTYADMNVFPFRMNTVKYSPTLKFSSFFLLAGFGYNGAIELAVVHKNQDGIQKPDTAHPLLLNYFSCEKMIMTGFGESGFFSQNKILRSYRHYIEKIEMPSLERKYLSYVNIAIPAGFSGVLVQISFM